MKDLPESMDSLRDTYATVLDFNQNRWRVILDETGSYSETFRVYNFNYICGELPVEEGDKVFVFGFREEIE